MESSRALLPTDRESVRSATARKPLKGQCVLWGSGFSSPFGEQRQKQDWFLKCLQGGEAHPLAACGGGDALLPSAGNQNVTVQRGGAHRSSVVFVSTTSAHRPLEHSICAQLDQETVSAAEALHLGASIDNFERPKGARGGGVLSHHIHRTRALLDTKPTPHHTFSVLSKCIIKDN
jgi:hypothetical protein